jgi:hypothetical protein
MADRSRRAHIFVLRNETIAEKLTCRIFFASIDACRAMQMLIFGAADVINFAIGGAKPPNLGVHQ